jgi:hypothetical protein
MTSSAPNPSVAVSYTIVFVLRLKVEYEFMCTAEEECNHGPC